MKAPLEMKTPLEMFAACEAVDVTGFVGVFPWRLQAAIDAAALSRQADRLGLSGLCLSHLASVFGYDTRSGNEELLRVISADQRFRFTPIINPTEPGWEAEVAWLATHGARGIRLVPSYHGYKLGHRAVVEVVAAAREIGAALHLSVTLEDPRERHPRYLTEDCAPSDVANFMRAAIDVPLVLSGLTTQEWASVHSSLDHGHDLDRVLVDMWRMNGPVAALQSMCAAGWASVLAYGTCQPVQEPVASAYQLGAAGISEEHRRALGAQNALRVLAGALPEQIAR